MARSELTVTIRTDVEPFRTALDVARRLVYRERVLSRYARLVRAAMERQDLNEEEARHLLVRASLRLDGVR